MSSYAMREELVELIQRVFSDRRAVSARRSPSSPCETAICWGCCPPGRRTKSSQNEQPQLIRRQLLALLARPVLQAVAN